MIIGLLVIGLVLGWLYLYQRTNDDRISVRPLPRYAKVMVIFPHPDDESSSCGGTLYDLAQQGSEVVMIVLTKGERGVEGAQLTPALKPVRTQEVTQSAAYLNAQELILFDFGDGELDAKQPQLTAVIHQYISLHQPDLIITYDESGLYGHPDHMVVSQIVSRLIKASFSDIDLWYVSRPAKVYQYLSLPVHMAKDQKFMIKRKLPDFAVQLSLYGLIAKIMSLISHQSQQFAFRKSIPAWLPLGVAITSQPKEYFYEAHRGRHH